MVHRRPLGAIRRTDTGLVTGKPPVIGGSYGREATPGWSVAIIVCKAADYFDRSLKGTSVSVQGFESVGANAAHLLDEWSADVVAVSNVNGGIYDLERFDMQVIPLKGETGRSHGPRGVKSDDKRGAVGVGRRHPHPYRPWEYSANSSSLLGNLYLSNQRS